MNRREPYTPVRVKLKNLKLLYSIERKRESFTRALNRHCSEVLFEFRETEMKHLKYHRFQEVQDVLGLLVFHLNLLSLHLHDQDLYLIE